MSYTFYLDSEKCVGCFACAVACMDQNDLETGDSPVFWRQVFQIEGGSESKSHIRYVSVACFHCEDAPCRLACPTGAISRDPVTQAVVVQQDLCIGCHGCSMACPFGVPRFGTDGTMQKCDLCSVRVAQGLEPACVRVCPTGALQFGDLNRLSAEAARRSVQRLIPIPR